MPTRSSSSFFARTLRAAVAAFAFGSVAVATPDVFAQTKKPAGKADPQTLEAKRLFDEGAALYSQGNYDAAIANFQKAFEISKKPLIYESIANAHERLGDARKARDYLVKWREFAPKEEVELLDTRIKNLEARIQREDAAEAQRKAEEERAQREREARERELLAAKKKPESGVYVPGAVLAGVGGAGVVGGILLDVIAATSRPDAKGSCIASKGETLCKASAADAINGSNTMATAGDILWIAGAVTAGVGVALLIKNRPSSKESAPTAILAPAVTPRGGGVWLTSSF